MITTETYFIHHGIAVDRSGERADEARFLTPKGIEKTQQVAQGLLAWGLQFDALLTSPLVRAQETAEILHSAGLSAQIEECFALKPRWPSLGLAELVRKVAAGPPRWAVGGAGWA